MSNFKQYQINFNGQLTLISRPLIMGILNVTPDSFFSDSRCDSEQKIANRIHQIINEGADISDIGGYSSRPFATDISSHEEYERLAIGLSIIRSEAPNTIISVDTFRADVARKCVENFGVEIINDISGGNLDKNMFDTIAEINVPYIIMQMRGNTQTMTSLTQYENVTADVINDL